MKRHEGTGPVCAFVGDQSLVVRCVEIAREAGLHVAIVASHNPDVLEAMAGTDVEQIALTTPADLGPALAGKDFDVLFSVAYLHIVPDSVLEQVNTAINFHDGPLPEYAGLHVTSWALANGENSHGVTWHLMTSSVDKGEIVVQTTFPIEREDSALSLNARCFEAGAQTFAEVAAALADGTLTHSPQSDGPGRMYRRRQRPTVVVDPDRPAADLAQSIRALLVGDRVVNTVGSAHLVVGNDSYVVADARVVAGSGKSPGSIDIEDSGYVRIATVDGDLILGDIRGADGHQVELSSGQITGTGELARALANHDPALHDVEAWWRGELAVAVDTTSIDELDASLDKVSAAFASSAPDAVVAAALSVLLASRSDGDSIAIAVSNEAVEARMSELSPLLSPPQMHVTAAADLSASELGAAVEKALRSALDHGPFLTDVIERDPVLRRTTVPPIAHLRSGSGSSPGAEERALTVTVANGQVVVAGRGDQSAIENIAAQLSGVITALQDDPHVEVGAIELTTASDRSILEALNNTFHGFSAETLDRQFVARAAELGHEPAVSCAGVTLSYHELAERVERLSDRLRSAKVKSGDVVGIALERSVDLISSVLAVLSVGATYLPLDPEYPADRLQFMVDDSETSVVIGRAAIVNLLDRELAIVDPSEPSDSSDSSTDAALDSPAPAAAATHSDSDLAYVIYTSGSTGTPKGVQLEHRQVANFFAGMDEVIGKEERGVWLAVTSLSFDISVLELLWTLTRGFHVVIKQDSGFQPVRSFSGRAPSMSLFHFAAGGAQAGEGYRLLLESSRWGDDHGFEAVWTPERHFHDFGAPYPNPSVVAGAVAAITERIHVRAGSVVLPLHSPVRVAEEWSVVDNLSNGRVGISFAAGWQPNDFVLNPTGYANAREELPERIEAVRSLWRGETVELPGPDGEMVPVQTLPRPVQDELPVWLTSAGSPASFERAGTLGVNLLTHLLGQSVEQLTENIERYRAARRAAGHEGDGQVTLMLHTFLDADAETARETAREPLTQYLGTAVGLIKNMASTFPTFAGAGKDADDAFSSLSDDDIQQLLELAADRYLSTSGLFGTVEDALEMVAKATSAGVDEVACLIDFGIDPDLVLSSLDLLGQVHDRLRQSEGEIETVASLVERYQVSHFQCTPSLASMVVADPSERASLGVLKHMMVGGEAFPTELATELADIVPGRVTNMYGPTETTIWSLTHDLPKPCSGAIPIGTPIANTSVHILDRHQRPLPVGVFGELFLGGEGVARGYLDRPELNAERFIELGDSGRVYATGDIARVRADGIVEFAGRSDGQVKIRGHRIELGEIEAVLDRLEPVGRSVVVARGPGEPTLMAFIVPASGHQPDLDLLSKQVAERLPSAMVPTWFESIDKLPFTPNGKVDRKLLREMDRSSSSSTAGGEVAAEGTEAAVAAVWREQLARDVGRTDNFFDIGGHSLLAVNVFRTISESTGAAISLTDVFRYPTVELFAAHLDRLLGEGPAAPAESKESTGSARGSRRRQALNRRGGK